MLVILKLYSYIKIVVRGVEKLIFYLKVLWEMIIKERVI